MMSQTGPLVDYLAKYRPTWPKVRQAIQSMLAAVTAYLVATLLELPQGYWAVMTAILVVQASVGASLGLAIDRLVATLLGAMLGGLLVAIFGTGQAVVVPLLAVSVVLLSYFATFRASLRLAPVTAAIVILGDMHTGSAHVGPLASAVNRVLEIGVGAIIAVIVSLAVFPSRAGQALSDRVGQTIQLFVKHLANTFDVALGAPHVQAEFLATNAKVRASLTSADTLAGEARRELSGHLADHADPAATLRTMRRLWYTQMMAARAARVPLPPEAVAALKPALLELRETATAFLKQLGAAFRSEGEVPELARTQAALAGLDQATARLRETGVMRSLPTDDVARVFALTFALSQLGQNLKDLADRYGDLHRRPGRETAAAEQD